MWNLSKIQIWKLIAVALLSNACNQSLAVYPTQSSSFVPTLAVERVAPVVVTSGSGMHLYGSGMGSKLELYVNDHAVEYTVDSHNLLSFNFPIDIPPGKITVSVKKGEEDLGSFEVVAVASETLVSDLPPESVCAGISYVNSEGESFLGTQDCQDVAGQTYSSKPSCSRDGEIDCISQENFPAIDIENSVKPYRAAFREGVKIGGIAGLLRDCEADDTECYLPPYSIVSQPMKAVDLDEVKTENIISGTTLFGVAGTLIPSPALCSADGASACLATASFPALPQALVDAGKMRSGLQFAGVSGTLADCVMDGSDCYLPPYVSGVQTQKAIDFETLSPGILKDGVTIGGVVGTLPVSAANCTVNGQDSCLAVAAYPAVDSADLGSKAALFDSSLNLAGIQGTLNACGSAAEEDCLAGTNYPAIDKANLTANAAKMHDSVTINGIAGTLPSCSALDSDCFLPTYAAGTQPLKAIDFDVILPTVLKSSVTVAGVTGNVLEAPGLCALDGGDACVTTSTFRAMDFALAQTEVNAFHDSIVAGGVTGGMTTCAADGNNNCLATALYPALQKSTVDAAKMHTSLTVAGVVGTVDTCAAGLSEDCRTTAQFPSVSSAAITAGKDKIQDSLTIATIAGTLGTCSGAGEADCFLPAFANPAQPLKAVDVSGLLVSDIRNGIAIAGLTGNLAESPAVCANDGEINCVTDADFPAVLQSGISAAKIHDSLQVGGVAGTLISCNAAGNADCLANASFPAADKTNLTNSASSVLPTLTVLGVTGTLGSCSALGSDCYIPSFVTSTQPLKAITFDGINAADIKTGTTIAGINGSLQQIPANCSADAEVGCVAVTDFPAVEVAHVTSDKSKIHSTLTAGGIAGTLASCSTDGQSPCYAVTDFPAVTLADVNAAVANYRSNLTLAGVPGTMADCAAEGSNCYLPSYVVSTQPLKAIDYASITPGVLKKGQTYAGVTGDFPSSTYPMTTGDAYDELLSSSFNTQIASSSSFGYFDRNGTRMTKTGDTDLVASNIRSGVPIFGVTGSYTLPAAWDVRRDVSFDTSSSGKLKVACRNLANFNFLSVGLPYSVSGDAATDILTLAGHPFTEGEKVRVGYGTNSGSFSDITTYYVRYISANTFALSTTLGGSYFDITANFTNMAVFTWEHGNSIYSAMEAAGDGTNDAIDNPWGSDAYSCLGVESTTDDDNVWKSVGPTCNSPAAECVYQDKITKASWTKNQGLMHYNEGLRYCDELVYGGFSDWRLPSQFEMQTAVIHGLYHTASANWIPKAQFLTTYRRYWTSTRSTVNSYSAHYIEPAIAYSNYTGFADINSVMCVRD